MRFSLDIESDNAECQNLQDVADLLEKLAGKLRNTIHGEGVIFDVNGNNVGNWDIVEDDGDEDA